MQCPLSTVDAAWPLTVESVDLSALDAVAASDATIEDCAVSLQSMPHDALLVDTRRRVDFAAMAASDTINLPASELLSTALPGRAPVVLLGTGKHDSALLQLCTILRTRDPAREVRVLAGGLRVLLQQRTLLGDASHAVDLYRLDAHGLRRTLASPLRARVLSIGPDAVLPPTDDRVQWTTFEKRPGRWRLKRALADLAPTQPLVIAAAPHEIADLRARVVQLSGRSDVMTYDEGLGAMAADATRDRAIADSRSWVRPVSCELN